MKLIRNCMSIVLAAALAVLPATAIFADQPALPDSGRDGNASLTIHKLAVEDLESLTKRADGTQLSGSLELYNDGEGNPVTLDSLTGLAGVTFEVTRVQDNDLTPETATGYTGPGQDYSKQLATGANGLLVFEDLPFGVYKVTELPHPDVAQAMEPFLIHVPLTDPTGQGWLYDLHVYPKNQLVEEPGIEKHIRSGDALTDSDSTSVGGTVTWQIDVDIPAGIALSRAYTVTDVLDSRLTYAGNLSVTFTNRAGSETALSAGSGYTPTLPDSSTGGGTLKIDFDQAGMRQNLADALDGDGGKQPTLTIRFDTLVNESARVLPNMAQEMPNQAELEFENNFGHKYKPKTGKPEVHTGGVRLLKVDGANNAKTLKDAEFRIYASEEDANLGKDPLPDPADSGKPWTVTSQDDGVIYFLGLKYGDYWLVETKAPEGYNLLHAPQKVTVGPESHLEAKEVKVENRAGFTLPVTGGAGTVAFTVAGAALMGGSLLFLFLANRRKKNKEA